MKEDKLEEFHIGEPDEEQVESFSLGGDSEDDVESFSLGEDSEEEFESFSLGGDSWSNILDDSFDIYDGPEYTISEDGNSLTIDAMDRAVDVVQDFIREKLLSYGCDKHILGQIRLCVEEIIVNIISYAYRPDIGKAEVLCEVNEDPLSVSIQFMDSGTPFDPLAYDDVDTSGKTFIEQEGGFGIYLVKQTMDDVKYSYENGKNILTIKKRLKS